MGKQSHDGAHSSSLTPAPGAVGQLRGTRFSSNGTDCRPGAHAPIFSMNPFRLAYDDLPGNSRLRRAVGKIDGRWPRFPKLSSAGDVLTGPERIRMATTQLDESRRTAALALWRYGHDYLKAAQTLCESHSIACTESQAK